MPPLTFILSRVGERTSHMDEVSVARFGDHKFYLVSLDDPHRTEVGTNTLVQAVPAGRLQRVPSRTSSP